MPWFTVALLLIAVIGASAGLVNPFLSASLQERAPKDMLARVFSVFNSGTLVASMAGMTATGWIADRMGPIVSLVGICGRAGRGRHSDGAPGSLVSSFAI